MRKVDYSQVDDATNRLMKAKADILFPMLLSDTQMEDIQNKRVKKTPRSTKVKEVKESEYIIKGGGFDTDGSPIDDFDIRRYMDEAEDQETGTLHDLKIDIRDLKMAKNFYDYCFNFLGDKINPPFSRQLWIGLMVFGEVCPCCSKKEWLDINNVPVDYDSKKLTHHLVLLEKGRCPDCGRSKRLLRRKYGLRDYIQLANVLGQRCVTSDTLILTQNGMEYIGDMAQGKKPGFSPYRNYVYNGSKLEQTSDFYIAPKRERVYKVTCRDGGIVKGTADHPLLTPSGFVRMENLKCGDSVAVSTDSQIFGTSIPSYDDAYSKASAVKDSSFTGRRTRIKRKSGAVREDWFTLLGLWVAEGRGLQITNWDPEVNAFLEAEVSKTFSGHDWKNIDNRVIQIYGRRATVFLEHFIGGSLVSGSAHKYVPQCVLSAPKSYVTAFLRGLYEGDGGLEGERVISYTSVSRRLIHELRAVMLNLGFAPSIRHSMKYATNGENRNPKRASTLYLAGEDLIRFQQQIGFMTERKQLALAHAIKVYDDRQNLMSFRRDKLPASVKHELLEYIDQCVDSLAQIPMPRALGGKSTDAETAYSTRKTKSPIGRVTLLNRFPHYWRTLGYETCGHAGGLYDLVKRMAEDNVPLTKQKLAQILEQLSRFDAFLSESLKHRKNYFASYLNPKIIWARISAIDLSDREVQTFDLTMPDTHRFVGNGIVNHNSGKSLTLAMYASYLTHKHLKFPPIATLTKLMQSSTELTGTFVSLTFGRARGLMWAPYKKIIEDSTWFQDYFEIMDHYKAKYGKELYKVSTEYMVFHHRNLRMYPSGPRSTVLRGDTRIFAGLDELGLFPLPKGDTEEDETSERANADEAHKSLFTSLGTMNMVYESLLKQGYFTCPKPVLFNVSSPYSMRDKMMRLLKESRETDVGTETILGINLPTWEVNPGFTRQSPMIVAAYNSNYEKAERDWGANPPAVHSRFIQPSTLKDGIFVNGNNSHNFIYQYDISGEVYGKIERIRTFRYPSVIAIDAGHTNNSFIVVGGHYDFDTGKTVVTTLLECLPTEGRKINFNLLYQGVILVLAKDLNAVGLGADQWQSIDLLYRIRQDMGLNPEGKPRTLPKQYSPKRADFEATRAMLENKNLILPTLQQQEIDYILDGGVENYRTEMMNKPVNHFLLQAVTIRDAGPTRAPEKGEHTTDDIWRAIVLLTKCIHNEKVMERLVEARKFNYDGVRVGMPMPGFASRSGMVNRYGQRSR